MGVRSKGQLGLVLDRAPSYPAARATSHAVCAVPPLFATRPLVRWVKVNLVEAPPSACTRGRSATKRSVRPESAGQDDGQQVAAVVAALVRTRLRPFVRVGGPTELPTTSTFSTPASPRQLLKYGPSPRPCRPGLSGQQQPQAGRGRRRPAARARSARRARRAAVVRRPELPTGAARRQLACCSRRRRLARQRCSASSPGA